MATSKQPPDKSCYDGNSCRPLSSTDTPFFSSSSRKDDTRAQIRIVPDISGSYDHDEGGGNCFVQRSSSKNDNGDIDIVMLLSSSTAPSRLVVNKGAVSVPPLVTKRSALFSFPLEKKKRIHDYTFVLRKQSLGLSTLVVLLLAFANASHIAEAKGEVNTLHQSNRNEKKLNYFER